MAGGGCIKHNENDWKFKSYKGTNLGYDMLCESVNTEQKEKDGDLLNSKSITNLDNFITNIDKFLVCKEFAQERDLQIKLEEGKEQEKSVDYAEDYFQLTPPNEQKGIREMHQDFNKQK